MGDLLNLLCKKFLCRESQIKQLYDLYGYKDEPFVDSVYIFGCTSTGKTAIITSLLKVVNVEHVLVNLIECYTSKILFEKILNSFTDHSIDTNTGQPLIKCDNMMDFINCLKQISKEKNINPTVIILDKAERLRDTDINLLPAFLRFPELSHLPISFVLISELDFNKLIPKFDVSMPIEVYFPQYNKEQLMQILLADLINSKFSQEINVTCIKEDVYANFLNVFLSVFYRVCRDLSELRYLAKKNFKKYFEPVQSGLIKENDVTKLWRHFAPVLKSSLNGVYLRVNSSDIELQATKDDLGLDTNKKIAQNLELPFYAKYLLIAAYLASYNPAKEDKRLFMKYHGKKKKSKAQMNAKNKVTEQLNTQLGPKPFPFDRLLAIFYSILEDKVGLNSNLFVQVSSLVQLQLLSAVGDGASLDNQKYKCNVSFEFIQTVSKMVGFNIRKYLYDFI